MDISDGVIEAAQSSPVYKFVMEWKIALPPHIEFRTLPDAVLCSADVARPGQQAGRHDSSQQQQPVSRHRRFPRAHEVPGQPVRGGQEGVVRYALAKQKAVRWHRRAETVGDIDRETADRMLREANCTREEADAIYKLTALCTYRRAVCDPADAPRAGDRNDEGTARASGGNGFRFVGGQQRDCNAPFRRR